MYTTDMYQGLLAETVTVTGASGDQINAFLARPLGPGPFPGMVLAHHIQIRQPWICYDHSKPVLPRRSRHPGGCSRQSPWRRRPPR